MKVLCINTYAGSLLLGASAAGCELIGSYEDVGYGQPIAKINFPDIPHIAKQSQWPKQELYEVVVAAHPPCSAFSIQNTLGPKTARGIDSEAFACTRKVLDYAMAHRALAVVIESVPRALPGAWVVHQHYADTCGYHLYRILQNGCMFGCQWRERFWAVFIRKGVAPEALSLTLAPRFQTVQEVIAGYEAGPTVGNLEARVERQVKILVEHAKLTPEQIRWLFEAQDPPHDQRLCQLMFKTWFRETHLDQRHVLDDYVQTLDTGQVWFIHPNGLAPGLMGASHWYINGRNLSEAGYKRIMGFPADYIFPERPRNYRSDMRVYLSKGVIPQVAQWVLEQVRNHIEQTDVVPDAPHYKAKLTPNNIADLRIKRNDWFIRHAFPQRLPPLHLRTPMLFDTGEKE